MATRKVRPRGKSSLDTCKSPVENAVHAKLTLEIDSSVTCGSNRRLKKDESAEGHCSRTPILEWLIGMELQSVVKYGNKFTVNLPSVPRFPYARVITENR